MGGRVYDPLAGRFTTADPIMQAPFWSQGLNRYAYVFNDPINATDPSGFMSTSEAAGGLAPAYMAGGLFGGAYLATHGIAGAAGSVGGSVLGGGANVLKTLSLTPGGPAPGSSWQAPAPSGAPSSSLSRTSSMATAPGQLQMPGPRPANLSLFAPERGALAQSAPAVPGVGPVPMPMPAVWHEATGEVLYDFFVRTPERLINGA